MQKVNRLGTEDKAQIRIPRCVITSGDGLGLEDTVSGPRVKARGLG